ncbi:unnamed protein product [Linum tenue]|uniref:L-gulonolactone oxidase n=1 Tax=Linum tenue TaxID=586396 RepID=A0AAV0LF35_9ROSI|nr:unnamed protein product [Linum tenue]
MIFIAVVIASSLIIISPSTCIPPPEDPIHCSNSTTSCTITNYIGAFPDRSTCRASGAAYPATEDELIAVVADGTRARRKMKVATRSHHSIPKLACPGGEGGLLISTNGVTLRQLIEAAAEAGLALPYSPYWWGLTVGGMLATGAHGSSLWARQGGAVHDYVAEMTMVSPGRAADGYVRVRRLKEGDSTEINAAKVSLGVLGAIYKVTFKLQPLFKRSLTYMQKDDKELGDEAIAFGSKHEFADLSWFPSQGKVIYRIDDRVPSNAVGNGIYDFIGFRATLSSALAIIRSVEDIQESTKDADARCLSGKLLSSALDSAAFGLTNDGLTFTAYPVIGYHNHLQASGSCLDSASDGLITACPWDSRIKAQFFHQTSFSIALSDAKDFIHDVQTLVALDPRSLCVIDQYNGILIRYVTASNAYLGKQEDGLDFDLTYYRSKDPAMPRLFEDVLEEIEQMAVFKYGGLPHWGKNRNVAFEGAMRKYKQGEEFVRVKEEYDPLGLFSSDWTDQVLGLRGGLMIVRDGCGLEGLCVCLEDRHCAPGEGFFCRPGKVYKNARVCRNI